jgi:hypothetical protein
VLQRAFVSAVRLAGIPKHATFHGMRHSLATALLQAGYDVRTMQELLGRRDISTTMISICLQLGAFDTKRYCARDKWNVTAPWGQVISKRPSFSPSRLSVTIMLVRNALMAANA